MQQPYLAARAAFNQRGTYFYFFMSALFVHFARLVYLAQLFVGLTV
jgi:hypothetical protein